MFENIFNLNHPDFWAILSRFVINLIFLFLLIKVVYFRYSKKVNYVFSFFLMGIVIFFIGAMLKIVFASAYAQIGMAIGLFAIFTILRLRTVNFNIKDMAYVFTVIAISAINSLEWVGFPLMGVFVFNIIIILSAFILEEYLSRNKSGRHSIIYGNLELLKPDQKKKLLDDIAQKTGKKITNIRIRNIDFKKEVAELDIYYSE